jgi:signal transduction histidine kinase
MRRKFFKIDPVYLPLTLAATVTVAIVYIVYVQTQEILKGRLQERITATVATASLNFNSHEISSIIAESANLAKKIEPLYQIERLVFDRTEILNFINDSGLTKDWIYDVTQKMKAIREINNNIKYVYLLSPTDNPLISKFVTDSDTLIPIDWDNNAILDEIEVPPLPGEDYDLSGIPAAIKAFDGSISVMDELYTDKWGSFLSGYAPIFDSSGKVVAVLGMDIQVDDFTKLIRETLIPFIVLALLLLLLLSIQTVVLSKIWKSRVEIIKELDRQKDELLGIVSHQLATPISALKWDFEMLLDGDIGEIKEEQKDFFQKLQGVTAHLSDLVSMILDVSRIQLGKMKVDRTELDLNTFFGDVLNIMDAKAKEHKVNLTSSLQPKMGTGNFDKRLMLMIIENLLSNAIKYTPEGGKAKIETKIENSILKFSVSDTGCGIPKKDHDKIFGKLFRASNVRSVDGNGFGLYVVKGAVEAQGGTIRFESFEGKGTTFFVEIPLK